MTYYLNKILEYLENEMDSRDVQFFILGLPATQISQELLLKGCVFVKPVGTDVEAVATGVVDQQTHEIDIILARSMKTEVYQNASQETGDAYLARVMDGRDADNDLQTNTIRYIVRSHMRDLGIMQPDMTITYNDDRLDNIAEGVVTATMSITIEDQYTQKI